ncbi:MAG TPA: ClpXP protease specificity-enhancing factor SspB [Caulobacteraceae bacterium]|nr:ClpXP protease specificity-enhancing factor SspB [Caulobacteraceae bacterium]
MPNTGKPKDLMGYAALQQEAQRGVVRAALKRAATKGLPGDHHFFITFSTRADGVSGPKELLDQYPDEMMIVLQHQFWDLAPGETFFSVTLRFGGKPKSLSIPYAAVTQFWDPSVDFKLVFTAAAAAPAGKTVSAPAAKSEEAPSDKPAETPNIVSLDQFRKK